MEAEKKRFDIGDVITQIDQNIIQDLKDFTEALKSLQPGEEASITYVRNGKEQTTKARLTAR
jgi:S1-C subfamily serine protease